MSNTPIRPISDFGNSMQRNGLNNSNSAAKPFARNTISGNSPF